MVHRGKWFSLKTWHWCNDCRAFYSAKCVTVIQHVTIQHRLNGLRAVLGPSVSILGCEHVVIVSRGSGAFHNGGVSTIGFYLGEMLLWEDVWGGRRHRLIGRVHWVPALNCCFVRSPSINSSVSAHGENTAIIRSSAHILLSLLLPLPAVCPQAKHQVLTRTLGCPSWKKQTGTSCFSPTAPLTGWNPTTLWVQSDFTSVPCTHCKFQSTMLIWEAKNMVIAVKVCAQQFEAWNITHAWWKQKDISNVSHLHFKALFHNICSSTAGLWRNIDISLCIASQSSTSLLYV